MSDDETQLITVTQVWSNDSDYPLVKFWCRQCDQKVFGFPEIEFRKFQDFPDFFNEEKFHCPICGREWNTLEPVFHGEFEVIYKNNPQTNGFSQLISGVSINSVMGMTVKDYLDIGERTGYDVLGRMTMRYFVGMEFDLMQSKQNQQSYYLKLPPGNTLSFNNWLPMQLEYDDFNLYEVLNSKFDEDDGFIGEE